eukprot:sb/3462916/
MCVLRALILDERGDFEIIDMSDKSSVINTAVRDLPSRYPQKAIADLQACCTAFKDLTPRVSKYVYDNGREYRMICLSGTIPMHYRGNTYNIPVNIWIHNEYPEQAPFVMVTPTKDMQIKPSRIVDSNGKVYLPYLHEWKASMGYDLVSLVNVLCIEFSNTPPLYSKQSTAPARPRPTYNTAAQQPPRAQYSGYGAGGGTPPNIGWNLGGNPQQPPTSGAGYANQQQQQHGTMQREDTQEVIKSSMVSKIEHDLKQRYQIFISRYEAEVTAVRQQEQELLAGKEQISEILANIETEKMKIRDTIELFKSKDGELREFLSQHERASEEDQVDQQIEPKTTLFKQYLHLCAEESALDDGIYYLAEALRNGVIEIQVFLKHVRSLARKKFMVRALINKVKETINKCEVKGSSGQSVSVCVCLCVSAWRQRERLFRSPPKILMCRTRREKKHTYSRYMSMEYKKCDTVVEDTNTRIEREFRHHFVLRYMSMEYKKCDTVVEDTNTRIEREFRLLCGGTDFFRVFLIRFRKVMTALSAQVELEERLRDERDLITNLAGSVKQLATNNQQIRTVGPPVQKQCLGYIIEQLRYLAEKERAITLLGPRLLDPENLVDLIEGMERDPYQDGAVLCETARDVASGIVGVYQ